MRVLFISKEGDGLGVAQRLVLEGHDVDVWIADSRFNRAGRGIVNRVPGWPSAARRADLIVADCVGLGRYEDMLRATNKPVLGCCRALDVIELNRAKGMELFERAGIKIPPTWAFSSPAEAKTITEREGWKDGWAVKPDGNISTSKTMTCRDESLWSRCLAALPNPCTGIVQRLVSGIEVSTEGWFNGRDWIRPFNHTFEEKKFLAGGLGTTTGCMGNVVVRADADRLVKQTVDRLGDFLRFLGYRGPIDINAIVDETDAYALEVTSRMGYDAVEALIEGLEEPAGDFLFDVAAGTKQSMSLGDDTMIAVRLSIPPWPIRHPDTASAGEPVLGIDEHVLYHLFLTDLERQPDGTYVTAAGDGVLLKATATGRVAQPKRPEHKPDYTYEARRRVYRTLDRIGVSNKQYRTDIGERVNGEIAQLKEWGWI